MWRVALAAALFCAATQTSHAIASEGGYMPEPWLYDTERDTRQAENLVPEQQPVDYDWDSIYRELLAAKEQQQQQQQQPNQQILEDIVNEIGQPINEQELYDVPEDVEINLRQEREMEDRAPMAPEAQPLQENRAPAAMKEQVPEAEKEHVMEEKPLVAQKKGQSEYVSFVEPVAAKHTKSVPSLDKRRLTNIGVSAERVPTYSSNLLAIAVGTVLLVGMVGTIVLGGTYYKRRRDTPDDSEYAPYAGTGPGFKKKGEKGDESLAYKAQLHHYQQAKQKIICGDDAPGMPDSDGEDENVDDENNFSVYECPGLAPTGDIEVVNPNFAAQP